MLLNGFNSINSILNSVDYKVFIVCLSLCHTFVFPKVFILKIIQPNQWYLIDWLIDSISFHLKYKFISFERFLFFLFYFISFEKLFDLWYGFEFVCIFLWFRQLPFDLWTCDNILLLFCYFSLSVYQFISFVIDNQNPILYKK